MIQINELRAGNWYRCKIYNGNKDVLMQFTPQEYKYAHLFDPIPLTHEILESFGFEKYFGDYTLDRSKSLGHNLGNFSVSIYDETQIQIWRGDRYCGIVHCQYLHQLQNLYWCFYMEELTNQSAISISPIELPNDAVSDTTGGEGRTEPRKHEN